jgi:hypothetical protein
LRAQAAAALEPGLRTVAKRGVHPVAGLAVLRAGKPHTLDLEFNADQAVQIDAGHERITPGGGGRRVGHLEFTPQSIEDFNREKCNLSFILLLKIKKTITLDASAGNAFDLIGFDDRMAGGRQAMPAKVVMAGRDEQLANGDHSNSGNAATETLSKQFNKSLRKHFLKRSQFMARCELQERFPAFPTAQVAA